MKKYIQIYIWTLFNQNKMKILIPNSLQMKTKRVNRKKNTKQEHNCDEEARRRSIPLVSSSPEVPCHSA